jgi:hypothetical protein
MGSIAARLARLEEGDDLPVYVGEPLDEDQVPSVVENTQLGARYRLGECATYYTRMRPGAMGSGCISNKH